MRKMLISAMNVLDVDVGDPPVYIKDEAIRTLIDDVGFRRKLLQEFRVTELVVGILSNDKGYTPINVEGYTIMGYIGGNNGK